ncbi:Hsp70 family protein [Georgenia subflava]|uniref:Hsp70 family protein n=1 Tax=Georgenia subflava TaxID=1622177 RepID=A0A6N7EPU6_9MICO|nr:Hsp70 family protein [Georgenia subflava]MPV38525.1 Hsp70 family protein [Georgenia subflava]
MHLGVDLGTTRTIVAAVDRGNYPVVTFLDDDGDAHESFPSVVALHGERLLYGFDAIAAGATGAPLLRSFKRALAEPDVNADTAIAVGDRTVPLLEILTGYLRAMHEALLTTSNLPGAGTGQADPDLLGPVVVAVPAHAHGAQRFLTLEAFRRAGFDVAALLNEPSAAGFEYTHRRGGTVTSRRTRVVVYDLGGGTFDASLVDVEGTGHDVLATAGRNRLGGDDFDDVLVRCALAAAEVEEADLDAWALASLREQCREAKERISPQSRRIALEVGERDVNVAVDAFYDAAAPLVEATMTAMGPVLDRLDDPTGLTDVAGIYLVGGGSSLPLVPRLLKERFGRRVHRSPHPSASTAIGLAIAADPASGYSLADRLSRGFGVFREQRSGQGVVFDPILTPDEILPTADTVVATRRYRAAHNIGWFRFVECAAVDDAGEPRGDIVPFAEVLFPFDPALRDRPDLGDEPVRRQDGCLVEERYVIDPNGIVEVHITDLDTGYELRRTIAGRAAPGAST